MYYVVNMSDLIERYFSSKLWLISFIISLIYLFLRLNSAYKKAAFAAFIAFFLFINAFVIKVFTAFGENSTFYRHLWAIPTMAIIGIAIIDIVRVLPRWFLKVPAIAALAIFLWFINQQEYIRCREHYFSTDAKMVTEDVIALSNKLEELKSEDNKSILFIVCPTGSGIQYGAFSSELSLYGGFVNISDKSFLTDESHNAEEELLSENADVNYIMSKCCANGIDYVITNKATESKFSENGYNPILETGQYLLYSCSGFAGFKQDITSYGQISKKSWYDENGNAINNEQGFSSIEYSYDNGGRIIREVYLGTDGSLCNNSKGYARSEYEYTSGILTNKSYFNANGDRCINSEEGYSCVQYTLDAKRQVVKMCYYDEFDKLINCDLNHPHAIIYYEYNNKGDRISEKYHDKEEKLSIGVGGYDEIRREYDRKHNVIKEMYYKNSILVNRIDTGYAEILREYDATLNKIILEAFYDKDGHPFFYEGRGYFEKRIKYDQSGTVVIEVKHYDTDGNEIDR